LPSAERQLRMQVELAVVDERYGLKLHMAIFDKCVLSVN
jgi:hypothetical protein